MRSVLKNKVLVTIIAILLLANIAMLVFFISGMRTPEKESPANKKSHSTESLLQTKIGFSEQQLSQFNKLKEQHYEKLNPLFEDLRITKDQFFLLVKDSPSDSHVDSIATLIGEKQKILDLQVFRTIQEVRSLCNSQQQLKFDSLLPKIAYKMVGHIRKGNPKEDSLRKSN